MATFKFNTFGNNTGDFSTQTFSTGSLPKISNQSKSLTGSTTNNLQAQYDSLQAGIAASGNQFDNRTRIEKMLGINADTKQKGNILSDTFDLLSRPLDSVKGVLYDVTHGNASNAPSSFFYGLTQGRGKNISGVDLLGLEDAHLNAFAKTLINFGTDITLDPLTWTPPGIIFKAIKKTGVAISKVPGIDNLLTAAKNSDFGIAVSKFAKSTKNSLGKMFKWAYGTSPETTKFLKQAEASRITMTHQNYQLLDRLLNGGDNVATDLFNYAKTNQLPGDKTFISMFKNKPQEAHAEMQKFIRDLGIENPETTWKEWVKNNFNGNEVEGHKHYLDFITDMDNQMFTEDWENFINTGNYLNADGTIKSIEQASIDFYRKRLLDWENLGVQDVRQRYMENIYKLYYNANPPEITVNRILEQLDSSGRIRVSDGSPEAVKEFLKRWSDITGLQDPFLEAKFVRQSTGKYVKNAERVTELENNAQKARNALENYKGNNQANIRRLEANVKKAEAELSGYAGDLETITREVTNQDLYSQYFTFHSLQESGKDAFDELQSILERLAKSDDVELKKLYREITADGRLDEVQNWLLSEKGRGAELRLRENFDDIYDNFELLDENMNVIKKSSDYKNISKAAGRGSGKYIKTQMYKQIENGINDFLRNKKTADIFRDGVIGDIIDKGKFLDNITPESVEEVSQQVADELLNLHVDLPAYKLTGYKGYMTDEYVSSLTYINSAMFRTIESYGLDPSVLKKYNILRNCINPEFAKEIDLINIARKETDRVFKTTHREYRYWGNDPEAFLHSSWAMDAVSANKALGYDFFGTDPLISMARTLKILPENLEFAAIIKNGFANGDIKILSEADILKYNTTSGLPAGKMLVKAEELKTKFRAIEHVIAPQDKQAYEQFLSTLDGEHSLMISIGLDDIMKTLDNGTKDANSIVNLINNYVKVFKQTALFTPGYHIRNLSSNIINANTSGIAATTYIPAFLNAQKDVLKLHKINKTILSKVKLTTENLETAEAFESFIRKTLKPADANLYLEYASLAPKGVVSQAKVGADFWENIEQIGKRTKKNNAFKKGWNKVFETNMRMSQAMDDAARLSAYRLVVKNPKYATKLGLEGNTAEELAESFVRFTFFDYNALTSFEKNVMRKVFPFYTWMRKNLTYQLKMLIQRPDRFNRLNKLFNAWNEGQGYSSEESPDWVQENMWLPVISGDKVNFLKIGAPVQDLGEIFGGQGSVLSRLNPAYKLVIESFTGKSLFNDTATTPLKSLQAMFWTPLQKLIVQPFDIPLGAIPLGNGQTFGQIFGHPNNYNSKNSMWYQMNMTSLHNSWLWQQIQLLSSFRSDLMSLGITVPTKAQLEKMLRGNNLNINTNLGNFKQVQFNT